MSNIQFPEKVNFNLPAGCKSAIAEAAAKHGVTPTDWLREAVAINLGVDHVAVPDALQSCRPSLLHGATTAGAGA